MKTLKDLSKQEKIELLKAIERKEVNVKAYKGKEPKFLFTKAGVWLHLSSQAAANRVIPSVIIGQEAKEAKRLLDEIIRDNKQSINH